MWTVLSATLRSRQKVEFEEGRLSVSSRSDSWLSDSESIKYKKSLAHTKCISITDINLLAIYYIKPQSKTVNIIQNIRQPRG